METAEKINLASDLARPAHQHVALCQSPDLTVPLRRRRPWEGGHCSFLPSFMYSFMNLSFTCLLCHSTYPSTQFQMYQVSPGCRSFSQSPPGSIIYKWGKGPCLLDRANGQLIKCNIPRRETDGSVGKRCVDFIEVQISVVGPGFFGEWQYSLVGSRLWDFRKGNATQPNDGIVTEGK